MKPKCIVCGNSTAHLLYDYTLTFCTTLCLDEYRATCEQMSEALESRKEAQIDKYFDIY